MDAAARDGYDERYRESLRVAYLEAKLDGIDEALRSMEVKLDAQIDVVDMLIDDRRGFDDGRAYYQERNYGREDIASSSQ